ALYADMPQSALENVQVDYRKTALEIPGLLLQLTREKAGAAFETPPGVRLSTELEKALSSKDMEIDRVGKRFVFTCPECNGALWEIEEGGGLRYSCHVGHS